MKTVIFDADGTLVDTVYFFIETYYQAYKRFGLTIARSRIQKVIGMGCDKAVPLLTSHEWYQKHGSSLRHIAVDIYKNTFLHRVELFPHAEELCVRLKSFGISLALASSSSSDIVDYYISLFSHHDIFDFINTSSDNIRTKPDPDIFLDIIEKGSFDKNNSFVIGDSIWDIQAARRAHLDCICVLTGGYHYEELRREGATEIYDDVAHLLRSLNHSIIAS